MAKNPTIHPNSVQARVSCEGDRCAKRGAGVVLHVRVNKLLVEERARLCQRCAKRGGWRPAFTLARIV